VRRKRKAKLLNRNLIERGNTCYTNYFISSECKVGRKPYKRIKQISCGSSLIVIVLNGGINAYRYC